MAAALQYQISNEYPSETVYGAQPTPGTQAIIRHNLNTGEVLTQYSSEVQSVVRATHPSPELAAQWCQDRYNYDVALLDSRQRTRTEVLDIINGPKPKSRRKAAASESESEEE